MKTNRSSICFIGLDNYPVLNRKVTNEYFGGESVQQTLLAKAYAKAGYETSMICMDYGQENEEVIDSVTVYKAFAMNAGLPVFRFYYPRITSVWAAMKQANADIYYQSCASMWTGVISLFCQVYNKQMIYRLAHDSDCIPGEQIIRYWRDKKIYEYGLRRADKIAAQSRQQQELLMSNYSLPSDVINMTVEIPALGEGHERNIDVLWVNNIRPFKRPEKILEIARRLPSLNITMVGGAVPGNEDLYEQLLAESQELENLNFVGAVPYHDVNDYFLRTKLFVNTSDIEGFPNSFLQAWARKVPVISFFDPDNAIENHRMGARCKKLDDMCPLLENLIEDKARRKKLAENGFAYVTANYAPDAVIDKYEKMLVG